MRLFDYLESKYASTNIDSQKKYTAYKHAETQAISDLINGQRKLLKLAAYLKILFSYLLTLIRIFKAPPSQKEIIKQFQDEAISVAEKAKEVQESKIKDAVL